MKYLIASILMFILFSLFVVYAPVFFEYHVARYQIGNGRAESLAFGLLMIGIILFYLFVFLVVGFIKSISK